MIENDIHIRIGQVVSIDDPDKCGRIKVCINKPDLSKGAVDLEYCYPLLPQLIHVRPKKGEAVIVLFTSVNSTSNKYYIGPIISQPHKMKYESYFSSINMFKDGAKLDNPDYEDDFFLKDEDIALYGRKGTEIILKEDDIRLQCGVRIDSDISAPPSFNKKSPAYFKMKYYQNEQRAVNKNINLKEDNIYQTTATIVADEINLLSNSSPGNYALNNNKGDLITDEDMKKIIAEAHVLPYGDKLVDFLKLFLNSSSLKILMPRRFALSSLLPAFSPAITRSV